MMTGFLRNISCVAMTVSLAGCCGILCPIGDALESKIDDSCEREIVNEVVSAKKVDGMINICVSSSLYKGKDNQQFSMKIPYEDASEWLKKRYSDGSYKYCSGNELCFIWTVPRSDIDYSPCDINNVDNSLDIISLTQIDDRNEYLYLGWVVGDDLIDDAALIKDKANRVKYHVVEYMFDDIQKSGIVKNSAILAVSTLTLNDNSKNSSNINLIYLNDDLVFADKRYFKVEPSCRPVKGKKYLRPLLPLAWLLDTIAFPVYIIKLLNWSG